jgi:hypothetical protein
MSIANSTLDRRKELRRGKGPKRGKPLPAVNVERARKRETRQKAKYRGYRRSLCYLLVADRARGRCEHVEAGHRCEERTGLEHHHLTYSRFGGKEIPSDMLVLCTAHHRQAEAALRPWRRRGTR